MNSLPHKNALIARVHHADAALRRLTVLDLAESNKAMHARKRRRP
jgi:hypothetical protein